MCNKPRRHSSVQIICISISRTPNYVLLEIEVENFMCTQFPSVQNSLNVGLLGVEGVSFFVTIFQLFLEILVLPKCMNGKSTHGPDFTSFNVVLYLRDEARDRFELVPDDAPVDIERLDDLADVTERIVDRVGERSNNVAVAFK